MARSVILLRAAIRLAGQSRGHDQWTGGMT